MAMSLETVSDLERRKSLADGHGAGEPLAVGHAVRILVLILTIKYTHNSLFYMVLDSVATSYIGWPPPAFCLS